MNKLIERVKAILLNPKPTWAVIKDEPTTVAQLFTEYLVILAAIPAVARFIGSSVVGVHVPFGGFYRQPLVSGLVSAVVSYVLTLVGIFVAAKVIDALAPTFGTSKNNLGAFKVAAYTWTPALVAGILSIIPLLSPLGLLAALYGIYLLYLGLQAVMGTPADKAIGYTAVSVVVILVIWVVIGVLVGLLTVGAHAGFSGMSRSSSGSTVRNMEINVPGGNATVTANGDAGQMTIRTKEGTATYSAGQGTKVPDSFPKDVLVYPGSTVVGSMTMPNGWSLTLQTKDAGGVVVETFKSQMTGGGWEEAMAMNQGDSSMLAYKKEGRTVSVVIAADGKGTQISLTVVAEKND